jgi:hypothetical protein
MESFRRNVAKCSCADSDAIVGAPGHPEIGQRPTVFAPSVDKENVRWLYIAMDNAVCVKVIEGLGSA